MAAAVPKTAPAALELVPLSVRVVWSVPQRAAQRVAEQAAELIEVDYTPLPAVFDLQDAMADDAPILHEDLFTQGLDPQPEQPSNISQFTRINKGDVDAGFAETLGTAGDDGDQHFLAL